MCDAVARRSPPERSSVRSADQRPITPRTGSSVITPKLPVRRVVVNARIPNADSLVFFQAEDGIRDYKVTGVQTCALPIYPTIMVVVPRLFEMLRARIMKSIESDGGALAKYLLRRALKIGADKSRGRLKAWDLPMDGILSLTLRRKGRRKVGGRQKAWVSGGAPLNPEVGMFFESLGITFLQGYGQTEAAPLISCNRPSVGIRLETVGPPVKNFEVRIADDGEIMVRGGNGSHG